jgi:hypothetical protein
MPKGSGSPTLSVGVECVDCDGQCGNTELICMIQVSIAVYENALCAKGGSVALTRSAPDSSVTAPGARLQIGTGTNTPPIVFLVSAHPP